MPANIICWGKIEQTHKTHSHIYNTIYTEQPTEKVNSMSPNSIHRWNIFATLTDVPLPFYIPFFSSFGLWQADGWTSERTRRGFMSFAINHSSPQKCWAHQKERLIDISEIPRQNKFTEFNGTFFFLHWIWYEFFTFSRIFTNFEWSH